MEKCSYCSRENPDEAIYCQFCGQKLNAKPIQVIPTPEYKATAKRKVQLIFGCCIILLLIGIGFTIYVFFDEGPDTSNSSRKSSSDSSLPTNSEPVFDVPNLLRMNRQQIEATFGSSEDDSVIPVGELTNMPYGGISSTYHSGKYKFWIFYDLNDEAKGFQIIEGLESDHYSLDHDWKTVAEMINFPLKTQPDIQFGWVKKWEYFSGYDIMIARDADTNSIWTIQALEVP
jgi:hypothetical protein